MTIFGNRSFKPKKRENAFELSWLGVSLLCWLLCSDVKNLLIQGQEHVLLNSTTDSIELFLVYNEQYRYHLTLKTPVFLDTVKQGYVKQKHLTTGGWVAELKLKDAPCLNDTLPFTFKTNAIGEVLEVRLYKGEKCFGQRDTLHQLRTQE